MYSQLEICNRALRLIGEPILTSLTINTKAAEECRFLYPIVKREVLSNYPWKCASRVVELNRLYGDKIPESSSEYRYKFLLPYDCITVHSVDGDKLFKRDGLYLYADSSNIVLSYTADIAEELLNLRVSKIIAIKLALELSYSLLTDQTITERLRSLEELEMRKVTQLDTQEGELKNRLVKTYSPKQDWLTSRF